MDRNFVFLMLVALTAPVLAGCTASAMPYSSAEDVRPPADEKSHAWAPDAQLVAIVGMEGSWAGGASYSFSYNSHAQQQQEEAAEKDTKTDGRAEYWVFRYVSSSKDAAYNVIVDQEGNVIAEEQDTRDEDDTPVGLYKVDSDEAVRIAFKGNDELEESQHDRNHGGMVVLAYDEDHGGPVWVVMGMSQTKDGMQGGMAIIDAVTGAVIASMPFSSWDYNQDYSWEGSYNTYPGCGHWC